MRKKPFRGYCIAECGRAVFSREPKAKYCSLKCAHARHKKNRRHVFCIACGLEVASDKRLFCSRRCHKRHQFNERARLLESGAYKVYNCNNFIRKYLTFRLGECCSRCKWNVKHPLTGRVPVEVEHIDGDWNNNALESLTLLCPNCHSLTNTYRGLNRGRGRAHRLGGRANPFRDDHSR